MNKKVLILDLDETLIFCENNKTRDSYDLTFFLEGKHYHTIFRPHLKEFIDYVSKNFEIFIWTSSDQDYAEEICKVILKDIPYTLLSKNFSNHNRIYSHFHLDDLENFAQVKKIVYAQKFWKKSIPEFNGMTPIKIKSLRKFIKKFNKNIKDIICIDNDPYKFHAHYGNFWSIKDFEGQSDDDYLLEMIHILDYLKDQEDVRVKKQDLLKKYNIC